MITLKYRPEIDGLRAFAVLAVIGFHYFPAIIGGGFVGVDVFFCNIWIFNIINNL
jgi:peptidoglycan/LPS O-acetylase OafA/YrhL